LLFIDVLLFKRYLVQADAIKNHAQKLEYLAINVTYHALNSKEKNKKDEKLAQLLAASRNSKRLQKELSESAELVALLSKSTVKDLSKEEKKKVQRQLLDIFKSIPSLAIFLLPGGAVLLPIFIKLIPTLLPSSFDENRIDKPEE